MTGKKALGLVVAAAVVSMLSSGHQFAGDAAKKDSAKVKCAGANSCKGHGACASADGSYACAGKNECKGKGWTMEKSEAECTKKGGTVVKEEPKAENKG